MAMMYRISYKPLWDLCYKKDISHAQLRKRANISPATLTKLNKNQYVALEVIIRLANTLNCRNPNEIIEFVPVESRIEPRASER